MIDENGVDLQAMNKPAQRPTKMGNQKRKIFLVSATLTKAFRGQKFQIKQKKVFFKIKFLFNQKNKKGKKMHKKP